MNQYCYIFEIFNIFSKQNYQYSCFDLSKFKDETTKCEMCSLKNIFLLVTSSCGYFLASLYSIKKFDILIFV